MTANSLRNLDIQTILYEIPFIDRSAKATNKKGDKYEYKGLLSVFNYEKLEQGILNYKELTQDRKKDIELARQVAEFNKRGG